MTLIVETPSPSSVIPSLTMSISVQLLLEMSEEGGGVEN